MSPQSKSGLAREHLTRASGAFETGDPVADVTFPHLNEDEGKEREKGKGGYPKGVEC